MCLLVDPPLADPADSFVLVLPAWETSRYLWPGIGGGLGEEWEMVGNGARGLGDGRRGLIDGLERVGRGWERVGRGAQEDSSGAFEETGLKQSTILCGPLSWGYGLEHGWRGVEGGK